MRLVRVRPDVRGWPTMAHFGILLALVSHNLGVALVPERIAAKKGDHIAVSLAPGSAAAWQVSVAVPTGSAASLAADALVGVLPTTRT